MRTTKAVLFFLSLMAGTSGHARASILYGFSNLQNLYRIDTTTGVATFVGSTGWNQNLATSLAYDPVTGRLVTAPSSSGTQELQELDTSDGSFSLIHLLNGSNRIQGMAFDPSGVLYSVDAGTDRFAQINTTTGDLTFIGPTLPFDFGGGLAYRASDGFLYTFGYLSGGPGTTLFRINRTTGVATSLGAPSPGLFWYSLSFDMGGTLYAINIGASNDLYILDPDNTASSSLAASITGLGDNESINQIAFAPVPEPASWVMSASGLAGLLLLVRRRKYSHA